jgi:hypothetical protein
VLSDAPAKNMFLQAVLSFKLRVLSEIKWLQILICAFNPSLRLFAVESYLEASGGMPRS